jgi:hypothetical protein
MSSKSSLTQLRLSVSLVLTGTAQSNERFAGQFFALECTRGSLIPYHFGRQSHLNSAPLRSRLFYLKATV